jgi:hypothetical protein
LKKKLKYLSAFVALVFVVASFFSLLIFTNIFNDKSCKYDSLESCVSDYSYNFLNHYFNGSDFNRDSFNDFLIEKDIPNVFLNYEKLSVILFKDGYIQGIGFAENHSDIFSDVEEAILDAVQDSNLEQQELKGISIVFSLLYNKTSFVYSDSDYLQNYVELGIHSLEIKHDSKSVCYPGCYPIFKGYDYNEFLSYLTEQIEIEDFDLEEVDFFKYDTYNFVRLSNENVFDWYRCAPLLEVEDITQDMILDRILNAGNWYLSNINTQTGLLEYEYYPIKNVYSGMNSELRQLASLWIMCKLYNFTKDACYLPIINQTFDYYLSYKIDEKDFSHINVGNDNIANNGFIILALCEYDKYPDSNKLIESLAKGIIFKQRDNGSYDLCFSSNSTSGILYYPGEAMLGLMKCYQKTKNSSYLKSVENGFNYYQEYWRNNKNDPMIPWHSQAYKILYEFTGEKKYADFIFEMNDWLVNSRQTLENSDFKDELGGFYSIPGASTSVYLEGVNDAYNLACFLNDTYHIDFYKKSIRLGVYFMLQTQYTNNNIFYFENPDRAFGGFRSSLIQDKVRVDNVQHAVNALIKTYDNKIFI